jgi:ribosome biogenesis GTPase A
MSIQWFPGHMHKASKEIKETLTRVDLIIEILDSRIPFSSQNPLLSTLRGNKPCIKVLSKSDLADADITRRWQTCLDQEHDVKTLAVTTEKPETIRQIMALVKKMLPEKAASGKTSYTLIMGIPNVGKSTIINILAGKTIAKTGNEPAVTKAQQHIKLPNSMILLDTPGILWPKIENENSTYRLAATGAIKDSAIDYNDVAFFAAEYLLSVYPDKLMQRYELSVLPQSELELIEAIGRKRGCLRSGGHVELDKASKILLTELRAGTLGRISLETPERMAAERVQIEEQKATREALAKEKKKQNRQTRHRR